jgi:hypothetical protein
LPTFQHGKIYVLILAQNRLGYILGDFFKSSSGHPAAMGREIKSRQGTG